MTKNSTEWLKLPGLFFDWELEPTSDLGDEFHIEQVGEDERGVKLYAVYHRHHNRQGEER